MNAGGAPLRTLAPLTVAVLAAHGALLQWQAAELPAPGPDAASAFLTRRIETPPPPPVRSAAPAARPRPAPAPRPNATPPPAPPAATRAGAAPENEAVHASDVDSGLHPALAAAPAPESPPAPAATRGIALPEPARMHYDVVIEARGVTLRGRAQLDWRHDGSAYAARLEVSAPFLPARVQTSTGQVTAQGLAPSRFADSGRRGEEATHFQRDRGKLVFSNNRPEAPLAEGMQDRLSVVVQLAALVGGDPAAYPPGTSIPIPTASLRDAEVWVFTVEGEEDLRLPGGALRTLKLQRVPRKEFDQKVELWLAPAQDYAPVRLRLTNPNGDSVDQRWSSTDKG